MKRKLIALLMGSSLVLAACGGSDDAKKETGATSNGSATTATASAGDAERVYNQKCSSCHAVDLKGGVGPDLTAVGSKLSQAEIETLINNGKGAMPGKLIEGEDVTIVAEWLAGKK